jgi:hypothetical protein
MTFTLGLFLGWFIGGCGTLFLIALLQANHWGDE